MEFSEQDLQDLRLARELLERPSVAVKVTGLLGMPIERAMALLPQRWANTVTRATRSSLERALDMALLTIDERKVPRLSDRLHKVLVGSSGAVGGALGIGAVAVELPISTAIMLRSIAEIARSEGESLDSVESRLACLEVFALGSGSTAADRAAETGYFAVRGLLARAVGEAAEFVASRGLIRRGAPPLVRLVSVIASRFGPVVAQKVAAQAIPLIGAAGGALINTVFMDHFQEVARGHFIVRRLERKYGHEEVRRRYQSLGGQGPEPATGR